ncbi:MAG: class I poly(R)-hydroxyalkanoic acid synthase [Burkholderiaceae bacterium]|nr:class I poly(R)-hydroxyalkanoic acid synthase [Burkholderiaceae bacterium]
MQRDQEERKKTAKPRIRPRKSAEARSATIKAQVKPKREPSPSAASATTPLDRAGAMPKLPNMQLIPEKMQSIQRQYLEDLSRVLVSKSEMDKMAAQDKRFDNPTWLDSFFTGVAALYVLNAKTLNAMTDAVQTDPKTHARLKFMVQQWIDATSPTNFFATNPEVQKKMLESQGESLRSGIENLVQDMRKGRISQTDETAFEIGKNVAVTPGEVVFQNKVLQLIQYKPTTEKVGAIPILFVPPSINKFYIMDLQQSTSLVKFTVDQGNTLFLVSWINDQDEHSQLTWDDYITDGVLKAIDVVLDITGQPKTNVLGFCIGGTIAATALAHLAARQVEKVNSFTLMTSLLDFGNTGVLDVFIDEQHVQMREQQLSKGGLMKGSELSSTFSFLRPNDLVWNYVVNNYLKGEKPMPFDLLYWNSDSTNLPGPFFTWYLRNMYLENNLVKKNRLTVAGQKMDLSRITVPVYAMGAREDHIVPWDAAWHSAQALGGPKRFVLGASGHIAGSINPASKNKRNFWVNEAAASSPEEWLDGATEVPGSWWNDWAKWIERQRGEMIDAPARMGNSRFPSIEAAPGSYVRTRAASPA